MDSLRYTTENSTPRVVKRVALEDSSLNLFDAVIAHNASMKKKLEQLGCEQVYCLELFDYLCEPGEIRYRTLTNRICIAGNLAPDKAGYISKLASLEHLIFHLYGNGFVEENNYNLRYQGAFAPEELVDQIDGSFGLVWDGNELDTCSQGYGSYLRYNNPHKLSLYLAAGMPVIVWDQSALAQFVQEHQIGIAIDSLENLTAALEQLSPATYEGMMEQARNMALDIRKGKWLSDVLDSLEEDLSEKTI
jgi:glycosyltransferase involved in cell wall biosynthesis